MGRCHLSFLEWDAPIFLFGLMDIIILVLYFVEGMDRHEMDGCFIFVTANIIKDCKQAEC